ncbi:MAG TPA: methionyl-tRNA formyltransferase [Patescibacteria group bacterium]|nr:methionyl-tRNA formyltransferase [Patescibacteria group bacterium]
MNIIFFGSSKYSTIIEETLQKRFGLTTVVTLPDAITGRKKILTPSPVKTVALLHNIPVITVNKLTPDITGEITKLQPDFLVVADFRLILPKALLEVPRIAAINVHHSLLPKYRGPAPAPFTILHGEDTSGVSIMEIAVGIDSGDILAQGHYKLTPDETTDSLLTHLNQLGAKLIIPVLENFSVYHTKRQKQNEKDATYTHYMQKNDSYINIENPPNAAQVNRMIRAYYPWPIAWTKVHIKNKIMRVKLLPNKLLQPEGKNPMTLKDFLNGYPQAKREIEKIIG